MRNVLLGHRHDQAKMRDLLDNQQGQIGAGTGQRAGVNQAIGHHAIERRGDGEVRLQLLLSLRH
ncbi:MAG: hypothetical protein ABSH44_04795 [Bryobacteraceae bacterium]